MFNVERAKQWSFANGLEVNPKADPETNGLTILILKQVTSPSLCLGIIDKELEGHCTHNLFYMHQTPSAYMVIFSRRQTWNLGPSGLKSDTLPTGLPQTRLIYWRVIVANIFSIHSVLIVNILAHLYLKINEFRSIKYKKKPF